jgi:hypothetical protein
MMMDDLPLEQASDCAAIAFARIVAACLELEWQIRPRQPQRSVRAVAQEDEEMAG